MKKAIDTGRLRDSVTRDERGRWIVLDPNLADLEWARKTDYTDAPGSAPIGPSGTSDLDPDISEASAWQKHWASKLAELKFKEAAAALVPAVDVRTEWTDLLSSVRTKLLGIPSRVKQDLPSLTVADVAKIEALVREALEDIVAAEVEG